MTKLNKASGMAKITKLLMIVVLALLLVTSVGCKKAEVSKTGAVLIIDDKAYFTSLDGKAKEISIKDNSASSFTLTDDGKYMFYISDNNLYRSKTKGANANFDKVAANIDDYHISANGNIVTFTNDDGNLYQYNVSKDSRTDALAKNVSDFTTTEKGNKLLYTVANKENFTEALYYRKSVSSDEVLIADKVYSYSCNEDMTQVMYRTDDKKLYLGKPGKEAKLISEKVVSVSLEQAGKYDYFFFSVENAEGVRTLKLYKNGKIVDVEVGATILNQKKDTCYFTRNIDGKTSLYYFNGKSITEISKYDSRILSSNVDSKNLWIIFRMSEGEKNIYKLAQGDKVYDIDTKGTATSFRVTSDGKTLYFLNDYDSEKKVGTVMKANLGSGVKKPKEYVSNVTSLRLGTDDEVLYVSDESFYINKKLIEKEITLGDLIGKAKGKYYYVKEGDLYVAKNGRGKRIATDIVNAIITPDEKVVVITNLDTKNNTYTINYCTSKLVKIADNVSNMKYVTSDVSGDRYH